MNTANSDIIYTVETIHQALVPSEITGVFKLDCNNKIREEDWKECLLELNKLWAMKRILYNCNKKAVMSPEEAQIKGIRLKFSGSYTPRSSNESRPIQKKSEKAGCFASLSIKYFYRAPKIFEFVPGDEGHSYHQPGDCADVLRCLPLSRRYLLKIQQELEHSSKSP
ncbi:hypothetical protein A0J61_02926 [Choanephora cucurbitarum]|uniref:Uncharacterized protein n=1 Tax=Choanephora cucurbitarum TaxID=101091 RepID=A0A1C7NKJ7_9FUNG|nr:hypothetical protein A0J61_02926 [Choanephora cucurbitarum]